MKTIIIQTEGSKLKLIKQLLKELGITFETEKAKVSSCDSEFVTKIKDRRIRASKGEFVVFDSNYKNELFGQ